MEEINIDEFSKIDLRVAKIIEVLNISTGRNSSTEDKFPKRILTESFDSGFATALMAKDLKLYVESAQNADSPIFLCKTFLMEYGIICTKNGLIQISQKYTHI